MGIKNPTYFLVALLQIEFCDEQTSQSPQYLEVAQLVEYLTGYSFRRPWFKSQLVYFYISPIPLYVMQWNWQVNSYQGKKSEYVNPQGPNHLRNLTVRPVLILELESSAQVVKYLIRNAEGLGLNLV